jgi:hypothetical protein
MDENKFPLPTPGSRTFQSAGTRVEFANKEAHKLIHRGDYEGYHRMMDSFSSEELHAASLNRNKLGGAPGGSTFERDEILCPPKSPGVLPGVEPVKVEHEG